MNARERREWDEFVRRARETTVKAMCESALVTTIVPAKTTTWESLDVRFALEVGASILLEKPLIVIVSPGRTVPRALERAADAVIHADLDTEDGQEHVRRAIEEILADLEAPVD